MDGVDPLGFRITTLGGVLALLVLLPTGHATAETPPDGPLWTGPRFRDLSFVAGKAVALDDVHCTLFELDLGTGKALGTPKVITPRTRATLECADELLGDVLLLRKPEADRVVEPLSRKPLIELRRPEEVEYLWLRAGTMLVAAETYTRHLRKLPPNKLYAFDRATGRALWTRPLVEGFDVQLPLVADGDQLYVKQVEVGGRGHLLLALRLRDGAEVWRNEGSPLHARVGPAGVAVEGVRTVMLLDRVNGAVRWAQALPSPATDIVVGERTVHAVFEPEEGGATLLTFAAEDGRVLWRRPLPFAPDAYPKKPLVLFAVGDRVFHLGSVNDHASLLSGFTAMTGQPTLAFSVAADSHVGLDEQARLLWAHTPKPPWQTVAFDPMTVMKAREVRVSGKVAHAPRSIASGKSLAGIEVCSLEGCVKTDRQGSYALRVKGLGFVPVWLQTRAWAWALRGLPPMPRQHELWASEASLHVDAGRQSSATWNPTVVVEYTPRGE